MEEVSAEKSDASEGEEFWKNHLLKSLKFEGSDRAYCEENELSPAIFSRQKRKFGLTRPQVRRRPSFVRVEPKVAEEASSGPRGSSELIELKWFAEVLRHLYGMR